MQCKAKRSRAVGWHDVNREKGVCHEDASGNGGSIDRSVLARRVCTLRRRRYLVGAGTEPHHRLEPTASLSSLQHEQPSARGTPVDPDSADRTVRLEPGSQWVNVEYGESVKFIVAGQGGPERSFAWRFDGSPIASEVDLSDVAPADVLVHGVRVFIAPDPRYSGE